MNLVTDNPLHRLTRGQRQVLRALHDSGWSYTDAAARLRMPESSVRNAVSRAIVRAKVKDRSALAYWLGREDEALAVDI